MYTGQSSWRTGVRLMMFGLVSMSVDLVPIVLSSKKETEFKRLCPDDHDGQGPAPIRQLNQCTVDPGHVRETHELVRGRKNDDGQWVVVEDGEIEEARVGVELPEKLLSLAAHPAVEVDASTFPLGKGYRLRPGRTGKVVSEADEVLYSGLRDAVGGLGSEVAFVGALRVGKSRGVYRLAVWDGQLIVVELLTASDLHERDRVEVGEAGEATAERFTSMVSSLAREAVESFDEEMYRHDTAAAVAALVAAKDGSGPVPEKSVAVDGGMTAMLAAVEAEIARLKAA